MKKILLPVFMIVLIPLLAWSDLRVGGVDQTDITAIKLGIFTGSIVSDGSTVPEAIQSLETAVEGKEATQTAASQVEAEAGTEAGIRSWSPVRAFQAIAAKLTATLGAAYDTEIELSTLFDSKSPADFYDYPEISIEAGIDGAVAPDVAEVLSSTNKAVIRQFSGAANQDVFLSFEAPPDLKAGATGLYFRVIGFVSNATAPAENEVISFTLDGASIANSELLSSALGTAVASTYTADATVAQYDRIATPWSGLVTITGLAAGETIMLSLTRAATTTDTYAQKFGVAKVQIKILRTPSGT